MESLNLKCRAKINLSIDVLGKRADNYHLVEMIMQTIDLYDNVNIEEIDSGIIIDSDNEYVPTDSSNIAYKAADLIKRKFNINKGVKISINKNIPVAAGLAGGSTNAAAVLVGLNKMWDLKLTEDNLMELGLQLGADVPFCILGGAAVAEGIGEKLTRIEGLESVKILICKPDILVSTKWVYENLDINGLSKRPNTKNILNNLKENDVQALAKNMCNVLESVTENEYTQIKEIKKKMIEHHALGSMMSGSGPTVFGIFDNLDCAQKAKEELKQLYKQTYLVNTYKGGIEIEG
ncbi:4-(cytidine 5'-diphospho)-2-C-methyl-D-erythritol kinase [Tepidibacter hydrothermalis]|uniref:4-diphosphocytidyl-2-C-methyl-D-erythritol kinase n=1 Tax=Tepidibacter hydrothermalis TaxID=3036126 RepID=A0ABY8EEW2_9FIRM|nr:4-(cytidine 5'-diphospho)-2-C-methyl-D-erythritol kinase [Tepidibacter hydrothermalis]WFD10129.1 4-(cytidine 5'-diphospho)-2-C-methyl-D-erythritol kinase [Tepidibacter hydrothermalis]